MFQEKFTLKKDTAKRGSDDSELKKSDLKYSSKEDSDRHNSARYERNDDNTSDNSDNINNIWQVRKSIVDSDRRFYYKRITAFMIISAFIILGGMAIGMHWVNTIVLIGIHSALFIVVYMEQTELQESKHAGGSIRKITPFPNDVFFFNAEQKDIAFILNRNSRRLVGFLAYKVIGVPVAIEGNISAVLRNLNQLGITCTYQFNYRPKITLSDVELTSQDANKEELMQDIANNIEGTPYRSVKKLKQDTLHRIPYDESNASNYIMDITFSFSAATKYLFNVNEVIAQLTKQLDSYGETAEMLFASNFSHYKIIRVYDRGLLDIIQSILSKSIPFTRFGEGGVKPSPQYADEFAANHMINSNAYSKTVTEHEVTVINKDKLKAIGQRFLNDMMIKRTLYHIFLLVFVNMILSALGPIVGEISGFIGITNLFGILWISAGFFIDFSAFSSLTSKQATDRNFFHPFEGVQFYKHAMHPGTLFAFIKDQHILFGLKFWTINRITAYFDFNMSKYIRGLTTMQPQVPILYSINCTPLSKSEFVEKYYDGLSIQEQRSLCRDGQIIKDTTIEKWLDVRGGAFDTIHLYELFSYVRVDEISDRAFSTIAKKLSGHSTTFQSIVLTTLRKCDLYEIESDALMLKSFILTSFKSRLYFENGSGMPQIPIIAKKLIQFIKINGEIKKGVEPVLPAEFVIPSSLNSGILFGFIHNTEVNKSQGMVGLEIDQFYRGLSVAGESESLIDIWNMAIILAGIKIGLPYLVFDFNGTYSALLRVIKDQPTREKLRVYKMGKNYSMDLFQSENPKKDGEDAYLSSLCDCFEIAYCLSNTEVIIMKKLMLKLAQSTAINEQIDLAKIHGTLYTLGSNFSRDNLEAISTIFDRLNTDKNIYAFRVNNANAFKFSDVIFGTNTIIIDLSDLELHEKILASLVFVIKMNHYAKVYRNTDLSKLGDGTVNDSILSETDLVKHIVVMNEPVELLGRPFSPRINPIGKFSEMAITLKQLGFGILLKCRNIGKVADRINDITPNYLALKTVNNEDIHAVYTLLGLDEFHNGESDSKFRKSSYQKDYLQKQGSYSAVLKRDDYAYPFPIELNLSPILNLRRADEELMNNHMESLGYNPNAAEKNLLKNAAKTKLEKDFAKFSILIPKLITFFEEVNVSTDISGLSKKKCLIILKNHVHDTLMSFYGNDALARQLRVEILDICIQHDYLEQSYDSGFDKSANVTPVYRLSMKAHTAIEEYAEKKTKSEVISKVDIIDESGNVIDEDIEGGEYESGIINQNLHLQPNQITPQNPLTDHKELRETLIKENIIYASEDEEIDSEDLESPSKLHSLKSEPILYETETEKVEDCTTEDQSEAQEAEGVEEDAFEYIYKQLIREGLVPREKETAKKYTEDGE